MKKLFWCVLLVLATCLSVRGQSLGDSIEASLLTCSPGTKVYSLYGHTGLRVHNYSKGADVVFNYGVFDFHRPHFVWHFVLGECDYEVAPIPYEAFIEEYRQRGSSVIEQTLNLTQEEANRLFALLVINVQPDNKTYRYNFLTNNCTTKARDIIEDAIVGDVVYGEAREHHTYRELLHRYTADYPWEEVGNDLLLGAECDTAIDDRSAQFLPEQLMNYFARATIYDRKGRHRPMVARTTELLGARQRTDVGNPWLTPLWASLGLLLVMMLLTALEYSIHRMLWGIDIVVMLMQGLAGVLLCFMALFSDHPTVDSNWQMLLLNPIPLFCIHIVVRCAYQRKRCLYHYLNLLWLLAFIVLMPWMPQDFSSITLPLALALLTRPISYLLYYRKKSKREVQPDATV